MNHISGGVPDPPDSDDVTEPRCDFLLVFYKPTKSASAVNKLFRTTLYNTLHKKRRYTESPNLVLVLLRPAIHS